jgi:hypothetical protein
MTLFPAHCCVIGLLALLIALPVSGQKSGGQGTAPPPTSGPIGQPGVNPQTNPQSQTPTYVRGRVVMDGGQPVPEPVSVALNCGVQSVQAIHTDSKGYFEFVLGSGPQGNMDMSAANDTSGPAIGGMSLPGGFGGGGGIGNSGGRLLGCELRISVGGYEPLTKNITDTGDITGVDVGTLQLRRLAGVEGASISVTSLQVPSNARKEFDKASSDISKNHLDSAKQHLEKAVSEYDKYAAAWNQLGSVYSSTGETEKANQAYTKAIASDLHYIPPYIGLAALQLQTEDYKNAADTAGKALALDSRIGVASFIEAAADVQLNRLDEAEKNAENAERHPHQSFPQVHVVLAQIFVAKQDYSNAAGEMRAYLKEAPQGNFAAEIKKSLDEIDKTTASAGAGKSAESAAPSIAP